jgi:hypothetical protein
VSSYVFMCSGRLLMILTQSVRSMQNDPVVSKASELLRLGAMPSPDDLRSGKVRDSPLCPKLF